MRVFRHEINGLAFRLDRASVQGMFDKNPRGTLPGMGGGKLDASFPRDFQRFQACRAQIFIQDANRR